jgi:hypothetical protein
MLLCEEDRPLSAAEAALALAALAALPAELRASAFRGGGADADALDGVHASRGGGAADDDGAEAELRDLVARCVRGEKPAPRAAHVLRATLQWRRDVGADTVRACKRRLGSSDACRRRASTAVPAREASALTTRAALPPAPQLLARPLPGADAFHAAWPGSVHGQDADGHVIFLERLADINLAALAALPPAQLVRGRAQAMEALQRHKRACAPAAPRLYLQHVYVLDCGGAAAGALLSGAARRVLRDVAGVSTDCYTGTLFRCHVINVHPAARLAWRALRPLLHPDTAAKVALHGGREEYLPALAREGLHAAALPHALGGTHVGGATLHALIAQGHAPPLRASFSRRRDSAQHDDEGMEAARCGGGGGGSGTAAKAGRACGGHGCSTAVASFLVDARAAAAWARPAPPQVKC